MTAITSAVLFRSESKGSGFHANERPQREFSFRNNLKSLTQASDFNFTLHQTKIHFLIHQV